MKEHDWAKLYADADKFMKKVGGTDFNVKTNIKTERWGEALVTVDIPKRNNPIENSNVVEVVYMTTQPKTDLPTHVTVRSKVPHDIPL